MQFIFSDHLLDTGRRELRRDSELLDVEPQVLDLLIHLVQNRDRVVSKDELIDSVWGGRIVSDSTLSSRIYAARKAVADSGQEQKMILTVARKGVRFVGNVLTPSSGSQPARIAAASAETHERPDRRAIAVLPFHNMTGDPEQDYFSDGISEDLITVLSKLRWFVVIARNSSFGYKRRPIDIRQVAEELGVGYVIEGSVRKSGDRVRITAEQVDRRVRDAR